MADWRKLAKALALADGRIDTKETEIIRKELYADGKIDKTELEFLCDLRRSASSVVRDFTRMVFDALKPVILADGEISATEANWLRKFIFADGKVDADEKAFLQELHSSAKKISPEFEQLYKQCMGA